MMRPSKILFPFLALLFRKHSKKKIVISKDFLKRSNHLVGYNACYFLICIRTAIEGVGRVKKGLKPKARPMSRTPWDSENPLNYCWHMRTKLFLSRPIIVITRLWNSTLNTYSNNTSYYITLHILTSGSILKDF